MRVIVFGVSGCGKSTVGRQLATEMDTVFIEGDDFHSEGNIAKMSSGVPLSDLDRLPWLLELACQVNAQSHCVLACSALRPIYRDEFRKVCPNVVFLLLRVSETELENRLLTRKGHFMSEVLLRSQLETLEYDLTLETDITVADSVKSVDDTVTRILKSAKFT